MAPASRAPLKGPTAPVRKPLEKKRAGQHGSFFPSSSSLAATRNRVFVQAALVAVAVGAWALWREAFSGLPKDITPLKAPKMKELPEFDEAYKAAMLWGSYRSGLYFGMRTRAPRPLLLGLMWFDAGRARQFSEGAIRHEAQQQDGLASYGWLRHDGRTYGRQQLIDGPFNITLQMVKQQAPGSGYGGDWAVRIAASLSAAGQQQLERERAEAAAAAAAQGGDAAAAAAAAKAVRPKLSLLLYFADALWHAGALDMWPQGQQGKVGQGVELLSGDSADVGSWALHLAPSSDAAAAASEAAGSSSSSSSSSAAPRGGKASAAGRLRYLGMRLQDGQQLVQLKQLVMQAVVQTAQRIGFQSGVKLWLPNHSQPEPNLAVFQINTALPASYDATFVTRPASSSAQERLSGLRGDALTALARAREAAFDARFESTFPTGSVPASLTRHALSEASKAALSNLLGSMGYFVGSSLVKLPPGVKPPRDARLLPPPPGAPDASVVRYWREALFTAVPSRSFFPRGFLWDEGFHQLLVARWDAQLCRDALSHWLDLMNARGWVPREQILGAEARARVPSEFLVQHPEHANPPSLYLPLLALAAVAAPAAGAAGAPGAAGGQAAATRAFLQRAWPRLEAWYGWFNTTQAGLVPGSYMWKGRDAAAASELNPKTLMSGLDDYPRASHPTPHERHVDLLAWMVLASHAMAAIGRAAGVPHRAVARYASAARALGALPRLQQLHYDPATGHFCDFGLHTEAVALEWVAQPAAAGGGEPQKHELVRKVHQAPTYQLVPSFGYVSLFPLLMRLLPPDSEALGQQLALLRDERRLWTRHGLRSLAPGSSLYKKHNTEHDAPYWRGQIWVNINFLALRALRHYGSAAGPHAEEAGAAYAALRDNLLTNLAQQYSSTGYLWEQYDDTDGAPKGSHPFTGWTALLTLVASEAF